MLIYLGYHFQPALLYIITVPLPLKTSASIQKILKTYPVNAIQIGVAIIQEWPLTLSLVRSGMMLLGEGGQFDHNIV